MSENQEDIQSVLRRVKVKVETKSSRPRWELKRTHYFKDNRAINNTDDLRSALSYFHVNLSDAELENVRRHFPQGKNGVDFRGFANAMFPPAGGSRDPSRPASAIHFSPKAKDRPMSRVPSRPISRVPTATSQRATRVATQEPVYQSYDHGYYPQTDPYAYYPPGSGYAPNIGYMPNGYSGPPALPTVTRRTKRRTKKKKPLVPVVPLMLHRKPHQLYHIQRPGDRLPTFPKFLAYPQIELKRTGRFQERIPDDLVSVGRRHNISRMVR